MRSTLAITLIAYFVGATIAATGEVEKRDTVKILGTTVTGGGDGSWNDINLFTDGQASGAHLKREVEKREVELLGSIANVANIGGLGGGKNLVKKVANVAGIGSPFKKNRNRYNRPNMRPSTNRYNDNRRHNHRHRHGIRLL